IITYQSRRPARPELPRIEPMRKTLLAVGVLAAFSSPAFAAGKSKAPTLAELAARIAALEADAQHLREQVPTAQAAAESAPSELDAMKTQQQEAASASAEAAPEAAPEPATAASSNPNAFNPAISVILNGSSEHHSLSPAAYARSGFPLVDGTGPSGQGISL